MKKAERSSVPVVEEEPSETAPLQIGDVHLYKVTFKRVPPYSATNPYRAKVFITFGTDEDDARDRIWNAFKGASFQREFALENVIVDFIFGGILKLAG